VPTIETVLEAERVTDRLLVAHCDHRLSFVRCENSVPLRPSTQAVAIGDARISARACEHRCACGAGAASSGPSCLSGRIERADRMRFSPLHIAARWLPRIRSQPSLFARLRLPQPSIFAMAEVKAFRPPTGVVELDPRVFETQMRLCALLIPAAVTTQVVRLVGKRCVSIPKQTAIITPSDDSSSRLVLLAPAVSDGGAAVPERSHQLADDELAAVAALGGRLVDHDVTVGYDNLTMEQALRKLLPPGTEQVPTSFESVGSLAHLNLRSEMEPYKYLIGRVLLDKNASIRTVVNKTGVIDSTFRTFPMEVIAGEDNTVVELRHAGVRFRFDFSRVYWNTRLAGEHERVATRVIPPGSVVADMFCGVGPFAIPLAVTPRSCQVYANDLNPQSHAALLENAARNKVSARVRAYNMDARAFIRRMAAEGVPFQYALMNLPADAASFLDVFVGLFSAAHGGKEVSGSDSSSASSSAAESACSGAGAGAPAVAGAVGRAPAARPLPTVLCYSFCKTHTVEDAIADMTRRTLLQLRLLAADDLPFEPPCYDSIGSEVLRQQAAAAASSVAAPADAGAGAGADADGGAPAAALKFKSTLAKAAVPEAVYAKARAERDALQAYARSVLPDLSVREVRNVAPNKVMVCAQFTVPHAVAYAAPESLCDGAVLCTARTGGFGGASASSTEGSGSGTSAADKPVGGAGSSADAVADADEGGPEGAAQPPPAKRGRHDDV